MSQEVQTLIFTDLDGTLLDHDSYSYEAAKPALQALSAKQFPVIPNTSKTREELQEISAEIGLSGAFIAENGAVIQCPKYLINDVPQGGQDCGNYWIKTFSPERAFWLEKLESMQYKYPDCYKGFSSFTTKQLADLTGLNEPQALQANQREYSEPLQWLGTEQQRSDFVADMKLFGANVLQGGRFLTVSGDTDKGRAMHWLTSLLQETSGNMTLSVALGDGQNDVAMLEAANIAVQILSKHHPFPALERSKNVFHSSLPGPEGWNEIITKLLKNNDI